MDILSAVVQALADASLFWPVLALVAVGAVLLMAWFHQRPTRSASKRIECKAPHQFTPAARALFIEIVKEGDEVDITPERVLNAKCLAFCWLEGELAGVAAIKRPNDSYRSKIERKTGIKLMKEAWPFELGYVSVRSQFQRQGHAKALVNAALETTGNTSVFATVRIDNEGMIAVLRAASFVRSGNDYPSDDNVRTLSLWIRPRRG